MSYTMMVFAFCAVGHESIGNALSLAAGFKGKGQAFGGEFGVGLRPIGSGGGPPAAWAHQSVARQLAADLVTEYNGDAPYTLLNAAGIPDANVTAAKAVVVAEVFSRETPERGFVAWLASKGYEVAV